MKTQTWNFTFVFEIEAVFDNGKWLLGNNNIPTEVLRELDKFKGYEYAPLIKIPVRCTGYYDPGRVSGPADYCYPPEGENEITLDGHAYIEDSLLSDKTAEMLIELLYDKIDKESQERGEYA
jgi:hypothetical protein